MMKIKIYIQNIHTSRRKSCTLSNACESSNVGCVSAQTDASQTHLMRRRPRPAGVAHTHTHTHTPNPLFDLSPSKCYSFNFLFRAVEPLQWSLHQRLVFVPRLNSWSLTLGVTSNTAQHISSWDSVCKDTVSLQFSFKIHFQMLSMISSCFWWSQFEFLPSYERC